MADTNRIRDLINVLCAVVVISKYCGFLGSGDISVTHIGINAYNPFSCISRRNS